MALLRALGHLISCVAFTSTLTIGLTRSPWMIWPLLGWAVHSRVVGKHAEKKSAVDPNWINWFEVTKLLGGIIGLVAITSFQLLCESSPRAHTVLAAILALNIAEAIVSEASRGAVYLPNTAVGVFLVWELWASEQLRTDAVDQLPVQACMVFFPLSAQYVLMYTLWNATFTYGFNFSWSTRLILISPLVACAALGNLHLWLSARCVSLVLNMILRATETSDFYISGCTFITAERRAHNVKVYIAMSGASVSCALMHMLTLL
jgi:hypothetical protein